MCNVHVHYCEWLVYKHCQLKVCAKPVLPHGGPPKQLHDRHGMVHYDRNILYVGLQEIVDSAGGGGAFRFCYFEVTSHQVALLRIQKI